MKAITLHQPWASAVALGLKRWETRSWSVSYRGPLAIHAAKSEPREVREFGRELHGRLVEAVATTTVAEVCHNYPLPMRRLPFPRSPLPPWERLPRGAVLAVVRLGLVAPADRVAVTELELELGDFSPGRFAWPLSLVAVYARPVPARGRQGLWTWDGKVHQRLAEIGGIDGAM